MKPPFRPVDIDAPATEDPLAGVISATEAGKLFALLQGEGLTAGAVRELLRPESASRLRAILTRRVFAADASSPAAPPNGKVLAFRPRTPVST